MTDATELAKRALELAKNATPDRWILHRDDDGEADKIIFSTPQDTGCDENDECYNTVCTVPVEKYGYGCAWDSEGNAEFIAAARTLLPDIATAYLELKAAHDKLLEKLPREYDEYREEVRAMKKEEAGE